MVKYRLLGPLTIQRGDSFVPISSPRHRKLLAALLISGSNAVSVERLIDVVWPNDPPATARQQVQNCVGRINYLLAEYEHPRTVRRQGYHYVLEVEEDSVDERLFRTEYDAASQFARRGDLGRAAERLRKALTLWRGGALEDVGSDRLAGEAARLEEMRVRALEQLIDWEFGQGRHAELIPDLSLWTKSYPYNELMHAHLAQALHQARRTADGLGVLDRLRQRLNNELGLEPGTALLRLENQLRGSDEAIERGNPMALPTLQAIRAALIDLSEAMQSLVADPGSQRPSASSRSDGTSNGGTGHSATVSS
ncbi:AfsR/SARP family transcriptional regulator [Micromonospora sp. NPDC005553]|uniref:AfsR/SARP family transcriptional regulator n=1 Tax=unclassified Micromonospora TaxID=2617518 RepID=UPI00339DB6CC